VTASGVRVHPHGLALAGEPNVLPLYAGAMHYWRHATEDWGPALDAMKAMGLRLLDTYVPWGVHETTAGELDFGRHSARLDVRRFLLMAHERGLKVVLRPGPHINAELTYFGLPERVAWDAECQARTPKGNPVVLPMLPRSFPVPSYASDKFHDESAQWFHAVGAQVGDLMFPKGPIVLLQIDNEGAMYFRDGPYDQDYHPDAVRLFRAFLRERYPTLAGLRDAWNNAEITYAAAEPPTRFDAETPADLARHLDWMEFHEHSLALAMQRFAKAAVAAGLGGVPTFHNFPPGEAGTVLNPGRLSQVLDFVGLDYYHPANDIHHAIIMRRTTELAVRSEGTDTPAYGAEMGAGFPPFFAPLDDHDSLYTLMCALGHGLRGFNLYMAVDRDRWIGAPIDPHGMPRPLADRYRALIAALERLQFHTLTRRAPVRLVVPRVLRRLARAMHAFGPVTPALFNVLGAGFESSCLEDDLGTGEVAAVTADKFLRAFERALIARGVPFAYAGGDSFAASTQGAKWIVCATAGGVKPELFDRMISARAAGVVVTIGPKVPALDGHMRPLEVPFDTSQIEVEPLEDAARVDALVAKRIEELNLPTYPVDPENVFVTVHEDQAGAPRVVMVMNPGANTVVCNVAVPGVSTLKDAIVHGPHAGQRFGRDAGAFRVEMPGRTVRLFEVAP